MASLGEQLRALRRASGLTQEQVAAHLSPLTRPITGRVVSKWEKGAIMPGLYQFLHLCRLYGVQDICGYFLGGAPAHRLNEEGLRRLAEHARLLELSGLYPPQEDAAVGAPPPPAPRLLRFYDLAVSAGTGQYIDGAGWELRAVDAGVPAGADYAVRIAGDSMAPRFANGQWIYVAHGRPVQPGQTGIFHYQGQAYCKVLRQNGGALQLVSLNPAYPPIPITEAEAFFTLGLVLE